MNAIQSNMASPALAQNTQGAVGGSAAQLTVSYPAPRSTQAPQPKQRVFTGTVTKMHDTFGFVDEDVFFQTT